MRSHAQGSALLAPSLQLVQLSAEEHMHLRHLTLPHDQDARLKALVHGTSFMVDEMEDDASATVEENFRRSRTRSLEALRAKADAQPTGCPGTGQPGL